MYTFSFLFKTVQIPLGTSEESKKPLCQRAHIFYTKRVLQMPLILRSTRFFLPEIKKLTFLDVNFLVLFHWYVTVDFVLMGKNPLNTTSVTACIEKGMQALSYIHYMQGCMLFICVQYNFMSTRTWIKALHVGQMKWTSSATSWHCECITTKRSFEIQPIVPGLVIQNPFSGNILLNISFNILSNYWKVFPLGLIIMVTFFRE